MALCQYRAQTSASHSKYLHPDLSHGGSFLQVWHMQTGIISTQTCRAIRLSIHNTVWRMAAIAPPCPRDLAAWSLLPPWPVRLGRRGARHWCESTHVSHLFVRFQSTTPYVVIPYAGSWFHIRDPAEHLAVRASCFACSAPLWVTWQRLCRVQTILGQPRSRPRPA